ncbi:MAG TPA: hypothetical protein VFC53_04075 [Dehalococcoidia bacterium]|nr:hypothetical protein [Dehalococcoidia bacterium]
MPRKRSRPPAVPRAESLRVRDFLALVDEGVCARLGGDRGGMAMRQRFSFVQYYRGSPDVHYEVWAQRRTGRIEIGLHFEGERERNYAAAATLARHASAVAKAAGGGYEIEEWTPRWTRLHCTLPAPALTPDGALESADRVCALIRGMEPLLERLGLRA